MRLFPSSAVAVIVTLALFLLSGCDESRNPYGEEKMDILTIGTTSDTIITVDSILEYTKILMKDSLVYRDSMFIIEKTYSFDTLVVITVDSVLKRDTVTVDQFDTLYSVDTLFIQKDDSIDTLYVLDTTGRIHDTIFIYEERKKVYTVTVNVEDRIGYFRISGQYFGGAVPELVGGGRKFQVNNGRLTYYEAIPEFDYSSVFYYTIVEKMDTLYGSIRLSDYIPDSLLVNGVACGGFDRDKNRWDIECDFDSTLSIDLPEESDTPIGISMSSYASKDYSWVPSHWYILDQIVVSDSSATGYDYLLPDPITHKVSGAVQFKSLVTGGSTPANESKTMEAYHLVTLPSQNYEIVKPDTAFNALEAIGEGGWTSFTDEKSSLKITPGYGVEIAKEGDGYAIAHGSIGQEGVVNSLRKMKKVFIRYEVSDSSDTLSLRLTSGVRTTIDEVSWNYFHAVLTSGAKEPGEIVIDVLDLEDFRISWGDSRFPEGTTLADDIAQEYLAGCDGIAVTNESDDPSDPFYFDISGLFIIGDRGIYEEAYLTGISE